MPLALLQPAHCMNACGALVLSCPVSEKLNRLPLRLTVSLWMATGTRPSRTVQAMARPCVVLRHARDAMTQGIYTILGRARWNPLHG